MFFNLEYVSDPIEFIFEVPSVFLKRSINNSTFNCKLFPSWFKGVLNKRSKTYKAFLALHTALHRTTIQQRKALLKLYLNNNKVQNLCEDLNYNFVDINTINDAARKAFKKLMEILWTTTIKLDSFENAVSSSIQNHYNNFVKKNNISICPFCCIGTIYSANLKYREHYDHHLPKSIFPELSVNFRNLTPMCSHCNTDRKKTKKLIFSNSRRTIAYYPYRQTSGVKLELQCVQEPAYHIDSGKWKIKITEIDPSDKPYVDSWKDTLELEKRYAERLNENYSKIESNIVKDFATSQRPDIREYFIDQYAIKMCDEEFMRTRPEGVLEIVVIDYLSKELDTKLSSLHQIATTKYIKLTSQRNPLEN